MMRINLIWSILIGLFIGIGSFFVMYKIQIPLDFEYFYNVPQFTSEEEAIIKTVLCTIVKNLEHPASYFVNSITKTDSLIIINMFPLGVLQSGGNSKGTLIVTGRGDEGKRFIFDKNLNLLKIEGDY